MKKITSRLLILCILSFPLIQTTEAQILIKDIYPGSSNSNIAFSGIVGNKLFFTANDGSGSPELWVSDREIDSTYMIGPVLPGVDRPVGNASQFVVFRDSLLAFTTSFYDDVNLYYTNGTLEGTQYFKTLPKNRSNIDELVSYNDKFYFAGRDDEHGTELWESDGTESGTHHSLYSTSSSDRINSPRNFKIYSNKLWFSSYSILWYLDELSIHKVAVSKYVNPIFMELFTSTDSEPAYFVQNHNPDFRRLVKVNPDASMEVIDSTLSNITKILAYKKQNLTYSETNTEAYPYTGNLKSLNASTGEISLLSSFPTTQSYFGDGGWIPDNDNTFLTIRGDNSWELWISNGSPTGTNKIDFVAGSTIQLINFIRDKENGGFLGASGNIFFNAIIDGSDSEIWISDGTVSGTERFEFEGQPLSFNTFLHYGNGIIFKEYQPLHGYELFYTDGTNAGTKLLAHSTPGTSYGSIYLLGIISDTLFMRTSLSTEFGDELYALPLDPCLNVTCPDGQVSYGCGCITTDIKDNKALPSGLSIYPNPTRSSLYISSISDLGSVMLRIYSPLGGLLKQQQIEINAGDRNLLHEFSPDQQGLYFVQIMKDGQTLLNAKALMAVD